MPVFLNRDVIPLNEVQRMSLAHMPNTPCHQRVFHDGDHFGKAKNEL
ncbi:unnamed protein product [Ixodes persulcatus]